MEDSDFNKLQSNIDMLISSLIMEFSYFSLDQCETNLTLLLQTIIVLITKCKENNSPEQMEIIAALLTLSRADEAVEILGKLGLLNSLAGLNIQSTKGGSYFQQFMKGGFKKSKSKKQRGGTKGCGEPCSGSSECSGDPNCPKCIAGKCNSKALSSSTSSIMGPVVHAPIPYRVGSEEFQEQFAKDLLESSKSDVLKIMEIASGSFSEQSSTLNNIITSTLNTTVQLEKEANMGQIAAEAQVLEREREISARTEQEFRTKLASQKADLRSRERMERIPAAISSVVSGYASYKFAETAVTAINQLTGNGGSFLWWLALTGGELIKGAVSYIPFISRIETLEPLMQPSECYSTNPFGNLWATRVVDTAATAASVVYDYTYKNALGNEYTLTSMKTCLTDNYVYKLVGECAKREITTMKTICELVPRFDIRSMMGSSIETGATILAVTLSALVTLYLIKIITLQTKLFDFKAFKSKGNKKLRDVIGDMVSDFSKTAATATGVGAFIFIGIPSTERSNLIIAVRDSKVVVGDNLLTMAQFILQESKIYEETSASKILSKRLEAATETVSERKVQSKEIVINSLALASTNIATTNNQTLQLAQAAIAQLGLQPKNVEIQKLLIQQLMPASQPSGRVVQQILASEQAGQREEDQSRVLMLEPLGGVQQNPASPKPDILDDPMLGGRRTRRRKRKITKKRKPSKKTTRKIRRSNNKKLIKY